MEGGERAIPDAEGTRTKRNYVAWWITTERAVRRSGSSEQHRLRGGVSACGPACPGIGAARPEIGGRGRVACCGQGGVSPCGTATPVPISWTPRVARSTSEEPDNASRALRLLVHALFCEAYGDTEEPGLAIASVHHKDSIAKEGDSLGSAALTRAMEKPSRAPRRMLRRTWWPVLRSTGLARLSGNPGATWLTPTLAGAFPASPLRSRA